MGLSRRVESQSGDKRCHASQLRHFVPPSTLVQTRPQASSHSCSPLWITRTRKIKTVHYIYAAESDQSPTLWWPLTTANGRSVSLPPWVASQNGREADSMRLDRVYSERASMVEAARKDHMGKPRSLLFFPVHSNAWRQKYIVKVRAPCD